MADGSKDFMLNTLKGKVWLAVITLAVMNVVVGSIAFIAASFVTASGFVPVLSTIGFSALMTITFAWWMSGALMRPIEKLTLLAKGIERSPGMSLPKTTGSFETDELLHTISRASQQLVNFIALMDDVTAGKTDAAFNPLEHSDRISASFQKLVSKVTDSIDAKKELDELRFAVNQISGEVGGIRRGEFIQIRSDFPLTKPISDAFRSLIERQADLTRSIHANSATLQAITADGKKRIRTTIEKDEARQRKLKALAASITESGSRSEKSMREIAAAICSIEGLLDELHKSSTLRVENERSAASMAKQFEAALHKLQNVGKQSLSITHVSKSVQDLARRSNMIALNASIQARSADTRQFSALTDEITSLSERAEKANKAISGISDSVVRDVNEAYASLQWVAAEVSKISQQTARDEETIANLTASLLPLAELPAKLGQKAAETSIDLERTVRIFEDCSSRSDDVSAEIRSCEVNYLKLLEPVENMRASIVSRNQVLLPIVGESETDADDRALPAGRDVMRPDLLELQGEN